MQDALSVLRATSISVEHKHLFGQEANPGGRKRGRRLSADRLQCATYIRSAKESHRRMARMVWDDVVGNTHKDRQRFAKCLEVYTVGAGTRRKRKAAGDDAGSAEREANKAKRAAGMLLSERKRRAATGMELFIGDMYADAEGDTMTAKRKYLADQWTRLPVARKEIYNGRAKAKDEARREVKGEVFRQYVVRTAAAGGTRKVNEGKTS